MPIQAVTFLLGVLGSVFIPYMIEFRDHFYDPANGPGKFSWKYVWPKILSALLLVVTLPLVFPNLNGVLDMDWQQAFIAGFGVSQMGELFRKGYKAYKS